MSATVSCPNCGGTLHEGEQACSRCGMTAVGYPAQEGAFAPTMLGPAVSPWDEVMSRLQKATAGDFQILDELGRGGMAAVYLAHDLALNRRVAIKVMAPGLLMGPGMVERFRQEAVTVANLNHPHIVTIHSVRQAAGLHYFVMKLIPGASLERIIREVRPLPIPVVQALVYQIAGALHYAHRRGVIHRDVKPSNILLDDDGNAVVTDFGIAKVVESPSHTQTGATVGTPAYMSPEQCWSREVTAASDQYSLGIVVYEMLTGRPPFSGPTLGVLRAHTEDEPAPVLELRPECPPQIAEAVHRMLDKDGSARFPTVLRAAEALGCRQVHEGDPVREELERLSQLGPDHPLQAIHTPHSPIPIVSRPGAPVPPAPPKKAEPVIEVRIRPTPPSPPEQPAARPAVPEPRVAPPPGPGASIAAPLAPRRVQTDWTHLVRRWWLIPTVVLVSIAVWWALKSGGEPTVVSGGVVDSIRSPEPKKVELSHVELGGVPERIVPGDVFHLIATARGARGEVLPGQDVDWSSDRVAVAEVSETGEVTALTAGRATITARIEGKTASVPITVRAPPVVRAPRVVAARVTPASLSLDVGDTARVRATLVDGDGRVVPGLVIWEVSDSRVATVSQAGVVTATGPGTVRVVATGDGVQDTATVTVRGGEPASTRNPPTAKRTAILRMMVSPWADVTIDGRTRGRRVRGEDTLTAGVAHRLRFTRDGYMPIDTLVTLRPAERRLIKILMKRRVP